MSVNIVRSSKFTYSKLIDTKMQGLKYHYSYSYLHGNNGNFPLYFPFKKEIIHIHMFIYYEYRALLISQFSAGHIVFHIEWYWWSCMRNKCIFSIQKGNNTYSYVPCDLSTHISLFFSYSFNISHIIARIW